MIVDTLINASLYAPLDQRIAMALAFLSQPQTPLLEPGRHEVCGEEIFALVQEYLPKDPEEGSRWEAHRRYIDVQYVVSGAEIIGYANLAAMKVVEPYDEQNDCIVLQPRVGQDRDGAGAMESAGSFIIVPAGSFMILTPQDAHMPGLSLPDGLPRPVKKIVVKVGVEGEV